MKLIFFDKVLYRVPQFPKDAELKDCWPSIKQSILGASEYFYSIVKDLDYENIENQPVTIRHTIAKYFNRSKFRATPYGTFASIGVCDLTSKPDNPLVIDHRKTLHTFPDWKATENTKDRWRDFPIEQLILQTNSSYYHVRDAIRYIYREGEKFELSDIPYYKELESILSACSQTIPYPDLRERCQTSGLNDAEFKQIITELIESQLLYTQFQPNILGEEYFNRIGFTAVNSINYTICEQKAAKGSLNSRHFKEVAECMEYLQAYQKKVELPADLRAFRDRFTQKYDMQVLPLMEVLDPVIGIGYGDMEVSTTGSALIKGIKAQQADRQENDTELLIQGIKKVLSEQYNQYAVVKLEEIKEPVTSENNTALLPNTINAIVQKVDDLILLDSISTATATSLLGRFNHAGGEIAEISKALAAIEEQSNPEIIFFDVAYSGEPTVDNVNRRNAVYAYQVCIANWDTAENRIGMDDIMITVLRGQIILFSRTLQKRMIPRLSTAYNYVRSDLSLFRLLCDIQVQGLPYLMPSWNNIFGDQLFAPRVQFKNIVLSPATWQISYNRKFESLPSFQPHLKKIQLSRFIKVGHADQTLLLDTDKQKDIALLLSILKSAKTLKLREAFMPGKEALADSQGRTYIAEYIISLYHTRQVYKPILLTPLSNTTVQRSFPPGSEWLYFRIYCHPDVMDEILINQVRGMVDSLRNILSGWFFIRYDEGGNHIRLRLRAKDTRLIGDIVSKVYRTLDPLLKQGLISRINMDTYVRELERYGEQYITAIEDIFCVDSDYILNRLASYTDVGELYAAIVKIMARVGDELFGMSGLYSLAHLQRHNFNREQNMQSTLYKELNRENKEWSKRYPVSPLDKRERHIASLYKETLLQVDEQLRPQLYTDLFHMHINRAFSSDQRIHEMIVYNYMTTLLKRQVLSIT